MLGQNSVKKLKHSDYRVALEIWSLFQRAYACEAELIAADNFPPLNRTVGDIQKSNATFAGLLEKGALVAVTEFKGCDKILSIDSFVVDPNGFRQGYGSKLLSAILDRTEFQQVIVETAINNDPALRLYEKFGFEEVERSMTEGGIEIVKLGASIAL